MERRRKIVTYREAFAHATRSKETTVAWPGRNTAMAMQEPVFHLISNLFLQFSIQSQIAVITAVYICVFEIIPQLFVLLRYL